MSKMRLVTLAATLSLVEGFRTTISVQSHLSTTLKSTPGGWENDDFLDSLSGGGGDQGGGYEQYQEPRIVPENDLTDEEITQMAMRSAQFYNTDASIEEAYGNVLRDGPQQQQGYAQDPYYEEEGGEFQ